MALGWSRRVSTRNAARRCLTRDTGAYAIVQALIARGVIGDFRAGDGGQHLDILRFGFTPLYIGFEDVGTPWNTCGSCWTAANGSAPNSTRSMR